MSWSSKCLERRFPSGLGTHVPRREARVFDFNTQSFTDATSQFSSGNQQGKNKIKFQKKKKVTRDITLILSSPKWPSDDKSLSFLIIKQLVIPRLLCALTLPPSAPDPAGPFSSENDWMLHIPASAHLHACPPVGATSHSSSSLSVGPFHFLTFQSTSLSSDSPSLSPSSPLPSHPSSFFLLGSLLSLSPPLLPLNNVAYTILDVWYLVWVKTDMSSAGTEQQLVNSTNKCKGSCHTSC